MEKGRPSRSTPKAARCDFCEIVARRLDAAEVWRGDGAVAFLDARPLLPGHVLLVPTRHASTLLEMDDDEAGMLMRLGKRLAAAVQAAMAADGSFLALNNVVSQSIPHVHLHVVPRWRGDGLFSPRLVWKRRPYRDEAEREAVRARISAAIAEAVKH